MVSAAKLKRIEGRLDFFRRYSGELNRLLGNLLSNPELMIPPLFKKRDSIKTFVLCVMTSDTGLCGSYNHRLLQVADDFINQYALEAEVQLVTVGKKGFGHFKRMGLPILETYVDLHGRFSFETAQRISQDLQRIFFSSLQIQLFVAYTQFKSLLHLKPTIEKFFEPPESPSTQPIDYIMEPDLPRILEELTARYFLARGQCILLEALISEHASRMMSMRQARDNAEELLEDLTLLKNKIRQASITTDIMEVVSAAESLKG